MSKDYNFEFRKAFGGISNFLVRYCGYRLVKNGSYQNSLWCPHHNDSEKNRKGMHCHANDDKDAWYCYACENEGKSIHAGSYTQAVMEAKGMTKEEAFKWLCQEAGIKYNQKSEIDIVSIRRMFVRECHKNFMDFYRNAESPYYEAANYIAQRGFLLKTVQKYTMGFSTSMELQALRKKGITTEQLQKADILRVSKRTGKLYNAFRNRVVMMVGNNIYGRAIDSNTDLRHLYTASGNLIFNTSAAENKKRDILFIVESTYDALSVEQFIDRLKLNAVAIGTCGTQGIHLDKLVSWVKKVNPLEVILIPDSDPWFKNNCRHEAGQKAGLKKALALKDANINVRIMPLPEGMDPNDLSKVRPDGTKLGASTFQKMINGAMPILQYAIYCEKHYYNFGSLGAKESFLNKIKDIIVINQLKLKSDIVQYISKIICSPEDEVQDFFSHFIVQKQAVEYFQLCYSRGMTDEQILSRIKTMIGNVQKKKEEIKKSLSN